LDIQTNPKLFLWIKAVSFIGFKIVMRFLFFMFSLFKWSFFFQPFYLFGGRVLKQRTFDNNKNQVSFKF